MDSAAHCPRRGAGTYSNQHRRCHLFLTSTTDLDLYTSVNVTMIPSPTPTPLAGAGNPVSSPSITKIIHLIILFFRGLLGH